MVIGEILTMCFKEIRFYPTLVCISNHAVNQATNIDSIFFLIGLFPPIIFIKQEIYRYYFFGIKQLNMSQCVLKKLDSIPRQCAQVITQQIRQPTLILYFFQLVYFHPSSLLNKKFTGITFLVLKGQICHLNICQLLTSLLHKILLDVNGDANLRNCLEMTKKYFNYLIEVLLFDQWKDMFNTSEDVDFQFFLLVQQYVYSKLYNNIHNVGYINVQQCKL
eukprot:TRINITY_DN4175_c0_g1_i3.p1 TRINITY_DN4175_c0_g1~~TRINITY_DN4175_c0_g1_i3.p1  ORF type:complete len:233 (-),score=-23.43 TRINITY_DN4175_c0_g1_i3:171-830(-)